MGPTVLTAISMSGMRTVVVGKRPPEVENLLERRRILGQDLFDEVWKGEYHMVPAPHGRHGRVDFELAGILRPYAADAGHGDRGFRLADRSRLLEISAAELTTLINWPR
jgi:hypothetical protein